MSSAISSSPFLDRLLVGVGRSFEDVVVHVALEKDFGYRAALGRDYGDTLALTYQRVEYRVDFEDRLFVFLYAVTLGHGSGIHRREADRRHRRHNRRERVLERAALGYVLEILGVFFIQPLGMASGLYMITRSAISSPQSFFKCPALFSALSGGFMPMQSQISAQSAVSEVRVCSIIITMTSR